MSKKHWEIRQWLSGRQRIIYRNLTLKEAYEEWKAIKQKEQGIFSIYRSPKGRRKKNEQKD